VPGGIGRVGGAKVTVIRFGGGRWAWRECQATA
jgi:hypothetical protein